MSKKEEAVMVLKDAYVKYRTVSSTTMWTACIAYFRVESSMARPSLLVMIRETPSGSCASTTTPSSGEDI